MSPIKLTIITVNYNNDNGLEETIKSVLSQTYKDFEYGVVDGGSQDNSLEIIQRYVPSINFWMSEKDNGIYHAMNKGIRKSKGEFLYFLNSGDRLYDESVLEKVVQNLTTENDLVYGDAVLKNVKTHKEWKQTHPETLDFSYLYRTTICHQACFFRKSLFNELFYYNENYKIYSDWEFLICAIYKKEIRYKKIDMNICYFNTDGTSSDPEARLAAKDERRQILEHHFPLFHDDYARLTSYSSYRFEQLKQIENSKLARYVVSMVFKCLLMMMPSNNKKR